MDEHFCFLSIFRMKELRGSLDDMSSLKEKELSTALEKVRGEIKGDLQKKSDDEKSKLEQEYKRYFSSIFW